MSYLYFIKTLFKRILFSLCFHTYTQKKRRGVGVWTVPQLSVLIIYNSSWSTLIQWIWHILSGDNLTQYIQQKAYFLFVINIITRKMDFSKCGRRLNCRTMHFKMFNGAFRAKIYLFFKYKNKSVTYETLAIGGADAIIDLALDLHCSF